MFFDLVCWETHPFDSLTVTHSESDRVFQHRQEEATHTHTLVIDVLALESLVAVMFNIHFVSTLYFYLSLLCGTNPTAIISRLVVVQLSFYL